MVGIGTYSSAFIGVENLSGDPASGSDLSAGAQKRFRFSVPDTATCRSLRSVTVRERQSMDELPSVADLGAMTHHPRSAAQAAGPVAGNQIRVRF
ncbi:MAG: hypothetical protein QNJ22_12845 [Desulfosarcinaceae bacterium]|nr:hypothetical protein [Desulfosarcinaceae bacterium]